jgi:hypothetical protein
VTVVTFTPPPFVATGKSCLRSGPSFTKDTRAGTPNPATAVRDTTTWQERGTHTFLGATCASG